MSRYYILNDQREAVQTDAMTWSRFFNSPSRVIQRTEGDGYTVSTVFLGLDHQFVPGGRPMIFETMIFDGPLDQWQDRYSTIDEAIAGHKVAEWEAWGHSRWWRRLIYELSAYKDLL